MAPTEDAEVQEQRAESGGREAASLCRAATTTAVVWNMEATTVVKISADTLTESILGKSESSRQPVHNLSEVVCDFTIHDITVSRN